MAASAPIDPPTKERNQSTFSGVRRKSPDALYLSKAKKKNVTRLITIKYTNKICSCRERVKKILSIKMSCLPRCYFFTPSTRRWRCLSLSERSTRSARTLFGCATLRKTIFGLSEAVLTITFP